MVDIKVLQSSVMVNILPESKFNTSTTSKKFNNFILINYINILERVISKYDNAQL